MKRAEAVNTFTKGLQMDLNPLTVPADVLTNCLNGTLITYNGNEQALQNDMGNARVETAMLPPGYIPVGTTSLGGIIYIVSYNPMTSKCQIGSFPSPERNLLSDEIEKNSGGDLDFNIFGNLVDFESSENTINNPIINIQLLNETKLYTGDKFKIFSGNISNYKEYISGWDEENKNFDTELYPKYLRFHIVSITDQGKIIYLDDNLVWTEYTPEDNTKDNFYIYPKDIILNPETGRIDLDEYRGLVNSNYDIYNPKQSGKLGIVAELEAPNIFQVNYDAVITDVGNFKQCQLYFFLNWSNNNTGKHKNRVNPNSITVSYSEISINHDIELPTDEGTKSPSTLDNEDYYSFILPDDFYTWSDSEYLTYLTKWNPSEHKADILRKNDGTDYQYIIEGPNFLYNPKTFEVVGLPPNTPKVWGNLTIDIIPNMPYGSLQYLKNTLNINIARLGSGDIDLLKYQYYNDDVKSVIDVELDIYPEFNKRVTDINVNFYKISGDDGYNFNFLRQSDLEKPRTKLSISKKPDYSEQLLKVSYNGINTIQLYYDDTLQKDQVYLMEFDINYSGEHIIYYRILHTSNIFNNMYGSTEVLDFTTLYLCDSTSNTGIKPQIRITGVSSGGAKEADYSKIKTVNDTAISRDVTIDHGINTTAKYTTWIDSGVESIKLSNGNNHTNIQYTVQDNIETLDPINGEYATSSHEITVTPISTDGITKILTITDDAIITLPYHYVIDTDNPLPFYEFVKAKSNCHSGEIFNPTGNTSVARLLYEYNKEINQLKISVGGSLIEPISFDNKTKAQQVDVEHCCDIFRNLCDQKGYDYMVMTIGLNVKTLKNYTGVNLWLLEGVSDEPQNQEIERYASHSVNMTDPSNKYIHLLFLRTSEKGGILCFTERMGMENDISPISDITNHDAINGGHSTQYLHDGIEELNLYKYSLQKDSKYAKKLTDVKYIINPEIITNINLEINGSINSIIGNNEYGVNAPNNLKIKNIQLEPKTITFTNTIKNKDAINSKSNIGDTGVYVQDYWENVSIVDSIDNSVYYKSQGSDGFKFLKTSNFKVGNNYLEIIDPENYDNVYDNSDPETNVYTLGITPVGYDRIKNTVTDKIHYLGDCSIHFSPIYYLGNYKY